MWVGVMGLMRWHSPKELRVWSPAPTINHDGLVPINVALMVMVIHFCQSGVVVTTKLIIHFHTIQSHIELHNYSCKMHTCHFCNLYSLCNQLFNSTTLLHLLEPLSLSELKRLRLRKKEALKTRQDFLSAMIFLLTSNT